MFPGGMDSLNIWISHNLVYPTDSTIQGKVYVSFVVLKDGSISDIVIEKGMHPDFDKVAKKLVKSMPNWKPGILNGKVVASRKRLPIIFKL